MSSQSEAPSTSILSCELPAMQTFTFEKEGDTGAIGLLRLRVIEIKANQISIAYRLNKGRTLVQTLIINSRKKRLSFCGYDVEFTYFRDSSGRRVRVTAI